MSELCFSGFETKELVESVEENEVVEPKDYTEATAIDDGIVAEAVFEMLDRREAIKPHCVNTAYFVPSEFAQYSIGVEEGFYSNTPDNTKLVNGISVESWRANYVEGIDGSECQNYQKAWNETLRKLYMDYDVIKESGDTQAILNRKQSILNLCWNPEIPFNESTQAFGRERVLRKRDTWEAYDMRTSTYMNSSSVEESSENFKTLFFVSEVTSQRGDIYTSMCEDASLDHLQHGTYDGIGSIKSFADTKVMVTCVNVPKSSASTYAENFNNAYQSSIRDSGANFDTMPNITKVVDAIKEMTRIPNTKFYVLYFGEACNYDEKACDAMASALRKVSHMEASDYVVTEAASAEFDESGTLIIYRSHSGTIDFGSEINTSAKLCKIYKQTDNIEGLKYEVAKLYFFYMWLDKEIMKESNKNDSRRDEIINCKRICTNVFSQNLKEVIKKEPDFIFGDYYNKTVFGGAIKVTPDTMRYSIQAMIKLLFGSLKKK